MYLVSHKMGQKSSDLVPLPTLAQDRLTAVLNQLINQILLFQQLQQCPQESLESRFHCQHRPKGTRQN